MIRKLWVKFDELDVVCMCNEGKKVCTNVTDCEEYITKFTPTKRLERTNLAFSPKKAEERKRKLTSELNRIKEI